MGEFKQHSRAVSKPVLSTGNSRRGLPTARGRRVRYPPSTAIILAINVTMGACAVAACTVYQEYVCEDCGYEFKAMSGLIGCLPAGNNDGNGA